MQAKRNEQNFRIDRPFNSFLRGVVDLCRLTIIRSHLQLYSHPQHSPTISRNTQSQILIIGDLRLASTFFSTFFSTLWMQHSEALREPIHRVYTVYPPFRSLQLVSPLPAHPTTIEFKLFIISILPRDATIFSLAFSRNFLAKVYRNCVKFSLKEKTPIRTKGIWRCQNFATFCGNGKRHFCFNPLFSLVNICYYIFKQIKCRFSLVNGTFLFLQAWSYCSLCGRFRACVRR
jgi:hypothetical protein